MGKAVRRERNRVNITELTNYLFKCDKAGTEPTLHALMKEKSAAVASERLHKMLPVDREECRATYPRLFQKGGALSGK
jgi:hypothetical protein